MTPQRKTGIMCALLSLMTGVASIANHGVDWLGFLCAWGVLVFTASIFWESPLFKALQVATLFLIGSILTLLGDGSTYIGITVLSVSWWYLYTYDFMIHGPTVKTIAGATGMVVCLAISTEGDIVSIVLRATMSGVISMAIWINAEDLILKAVARAERIARLEAEIRELKLREMTAKLEEVAEAGMVLVKEVTRSKHDAQ